MAPEPEVDAASAGTSTISATFAAGRNTSRLRPRAKCQQQTPNTTTAPAVSPASIVCTKAQSAHVARDELPDARQLRLAVHDLVADGVLHPRVRDEDEVRRQPASRATAIQSVARWSRGESRFQPKIQSPRNVDSRKNAARPSIASGAPKTLPTNREYTDQFIPNWNSCTSPVATPIAKLIRNSVPKKRVSRSHVSLPVRCQSVWKIATIGPEPERQRDEQEVVERRRRELAARQVDRGSTRGSGALDPPLGTERLSGLESDQRTHRAKGVRRTGHRLDRNARRADVRQRVAAEDHHVAVALADPEDEAPARRVVQHDPCAPVAVRLQVGVAVVELDRRRRRADGGSRTRCRRPGSPRSAGLARPIAAQCAPGRGARAHRSSPRRASE